MSVRWSLMILMLCGAGCRSPQPGPDEPGAPPPAGIIRQVNGPERYLIFEAFFTVPAGQEMRVLRDGRLIGRARALGFRRRGIQSADILEGRPAPGDFVLPEPPRMSP